VGLFLILTRFTHTHFTHAQGGGQRWTAASVYVCIYLCLPLAGGFLQTNLRQKDCHFRPHTNRLAAPAHTSTRTSTKTTTTQAYTHTPLRCIVRSLAKADGEGGGGGLGTGDLRNKNKQSRRVGKRSDARIWVSNEVFMCVCVCVCVCV